MNNYNIIEQSGSTRIITLDLTSKLLQDGIIEINDEFTPETVSNWRNALLYLKTHITPDQSKESPIQLHINSPGGDAYSMFGLLATIQSMQKAGYIISTINVGMAASAACFILMAGSKGYRKSLQHCRAMIHTVSSASFGKVYEMISDVEETKNIQAELDNIVSSLADERLIDKSKYFDFWMSPEMAKEYCVIDDIIK